MEGSLFELVVNWQQLAEMAENPDTTDEEFLQTVEDTIESIEGDIDDKLDAREYIKTKFKGLRETCTGEAKCYEAEANRLKERAAMWQRAMDRIDKGSMEALRIFEGGKRKTARHTFWIAKTSKVIVDVDPEKLPVKFRRVKIDADKTLLKQALQEDPKKYKKFAHIEETEGLRVR